MDSLSKGIEAYIKIMCDLLGVSEKEFLTSRAGLLPFGRYILVQYLYSLGYNKSEIGRIINKNHSSIVNGLKRLQEALETPGYDDIRNLKDKFLKKMDTLDEELKTLSLTRCIWKVSVKDRLCQHCSINNCIDRNDR